MEEKIYTVTGISEMSDGMLRLVNHIASNKYTADKIAAEYGITDENIDHVLLIASEELSNRVLKHLKKMEGEEE